MRSRTQLTALVCAAIAVGLISAPPAVAAPNPHSAPAAEAAPAARKKPPRMTVSKLKTTTVTSPFTFEIRRRVPVLKGSSAKNRKMVRRWASKAIATERRGLIERRAACSGEFESSPILSVGLVGARIYKKRYASATMSVFTSSGCHLSEQSAVSSLLIDLKTGRRVPVSKFVALGSEVTRLAITSRLMTDPESSCVGTIQPDAVPRPSGWELTRKGVRFWFPMKTIAGPACGTMRTTVPWRELASRADLKGKRTVRVYVDTPPGSPPSSAYGALVFGAQGRGLALYEAAIDSHAYCSLGVRKGRSYVAYNTYDAYRFTGKLTGTKARPGLKLPAPLRLATKAEKRHLKRHLTLDPFKACWN